MKKKLLKSEQEYKEYCLPICEKYQNVHVDVALGLQIVRECYDTDEDGNDIDEDGNIIPLETVDNVQVELWVSELQFPIILLHEIETEYIKGSEVSVILVETVSLSEFG